MININDLDLGNILLDEKAQENLLFVMLYTKLCMVQNL